MPVLFLMEAFDPVLPGEIRHVVRIPESEMQTTVDPNQEHAVAVDGVAGRGSVSDDIAVCVNAQSADGGVVRALKLGECGVDAVQHHTVDSHRRLVALPIYDVPIPSRGSMGFGKGCAGKRYEEKFVMIEGGVVFVGEEGAVGGGGPPDVGNVVFEVGSAVVAGEALVEKSKTLVGVGPVAVEIEVDAEDRPIRIFCGVVVLFACFELRFGPLNELHAVRLTDRVCEHRPDAGRRAAQRLDPVGVLHALLIGRPVDI